MKNIISTVIMVVAFFAIITAGFNTQEVRECKEWSQSSGHSWAKWQIEQCHAHQVELK